MSKEKRQTLFEKQNWYKLFVKRLSPFNSSTRLEFLIKDGYSYDIISYAFDWSESQEGYNYWHEISIKWQNLIRDVS